MPLPPEMEQIGSHPEERYARDMQPVPEEIKPLLNLIQVELFEVQH